jgi:hypothetical protein
MPISPGEVLFEDISLVLLLSLPISSPGVEVLVKRQPGAAVSAAQSKSAAGIERDM